MGVRRRGRAARRCGARPDPQGGPAGHRTGHGLRSRGAHQRRGVRAHRGGLPLGGRHGRRSRPGRRLADLLHRRLAHRPAGRPPPQEPGARRRAPPRAHRGHRRPAGARRRAVEQPGGVGCRGVAAEVPWCWERCSTASPSRQPSASACSAAGRWAWRWWRRCSCPTSPSRCRRRPGSRRPGGRRRWILGLWSVVVAASTVVVGARLRAARRRVGGDGGVHPDLRRRGHPHDAGRHDDARGGRARRAGSWACSPCWASPWRSSSSAA